MVDMEGRVEYTEFDESISLLHARQRMETRGRVVKYFLLLFYLMFSFFLSIVIEKKFWEINKKKLLSFLLNCASLFVIDVVVRLLYYHFSVSMFACFFIFFDNQY